MKILVTGATGFLGHYVINGLLQEGLHVIASSANPGRAAEASWFDKVEYIPFDLSQAEPQQDCYRFFGKPNRLIHLAWEGLPNYKASFHTDINYPRHAALLENMVANGLRNITVTGTCLEYGMQEGCLREDMPVYPVNPYARAKDLLRRFLEDLQGKYAFSMKWARLFYMYGRGQNPNSLFSQLDRALNEQAAVFNMSGGEQVRDYLPVEQVASYIVRMALQDEVSGIINVCSGKPITVRRMIDEYLAARGKQIRLNTGFYPYTDYEPMSFWGDAAKLQTIP